jgi:thiol-disulfide isomerase/thioredoxin
LKPKETKKFSDVANTSTRAEEVTVYFFHVDWCPHCKTALPEWNNFRSQYDGKSVNGVMINCVDMDCTKETPAVENALTTYGVDSYPTVKMLKDGKQITFESKITSTSLEKFVTTMTAN